MAINKNICIIGCGGIGSALFQDLVRTKIASQSDVRIILVDGDRVEQKNIRRQHFSYSQIGMFKAEALANTASKVLNLKNIGYINKYILISTDLVEIFDNLSGDIIIIGCVDNHSARRIIEEYYTATNKGRCYYLDCSNGVDNGEVVAVYKDNYDKSINSGSLRSEYDPSVLTDKTDEKTIEFENTVSCSNKIDEGNEQTIIANRKAAIIALELVTEYFKYSYKIGIFYFKGCVIERATRISKIN